MSSQVLGMDNGRTIIEVILGFMVTMEFTNEKQVPQIQVAQFLAKKIHTQLVNLTVEKHFRYQNYLMNLLFFFNQ